MRTRIVLAIVMALAMALGATGVVSADEKSGEPGPWTAKPIHGALVGNGGGAFWKLVIAYPGDSQKLDIRMDFNPADPVMSRGVGMALYDQKGFKVGTATKAGEEDQDTMLVSYGTRDAATLILEVSNYIQGIPINFTVWVQGVPGSAVQALIAGQTPVAPVPATTPKPAAAPAPAKPQAPVPSASPQPAAAPKPMAGSLAGSASGTFAKFWVKYNTAVKSVLTMTYSPADPIINRGIAIRIYGPSGEVAKSTDTAENNVARVSFDSVAGAMYLIQVENYIQGVTIWYSISGFEGAVAVSAPGAVGKAVSSGNIVNTWQKEGLGTYLTDSKGMTLYLFTKDMRGHDQIAPTSACTTTQCLTAWPVFYAANITVAPGLEKSDFSAFTRSDGKMQLAYKGWPLYTWWKDAKPGDTTGQGVGGVWYVVNPGENSPQSGS